MGRNLGKGAKGGKAKGSASRQATPTPPPKHQLSNQEPSPEPKRPKVNNAGDKEDSGNATKDINRRVEEYLASLVEDEGSDLDGDIGSDNDEKDKTNEEVDAIIGKIDAVPKRFENLATLRSLLLTLPYDRLLGQLKSWTTIVAATPKVGSMSVLKVWLQSHLFKDHILYLLKGFILPQEEETTTRTRGDDFNTVMTIISKTKARKNRTLHKTNVDRSEWKYCDWLASTLDRVFESNESDCDGLFEGSTVADERKYVIYFAAIRQALNDGSKSRRSRLWSLLALTPQEKKDLVKAFPQVDGTFDEVRAKTLGKASMDTFPKGHPWLFLETL